MGYYERGRDSTLLVNLGLFLWPSQDTEEAAAVSCCALLKMWFSEAPRGLGVSIALEAGRPRPVFQHFHATWHPSEGHERLS